MTTNLVKEKLKRGGIAFGAWVNIPSPVVAEIMALAGFDFLVIDMEHGAIHVESAQILMQAISASDVTPMVRLGGYQHALVNKILDAGPQGVIVPMVNSREEAADAVGAMLYPPDGNRGIGLGRIHAFDPGVRDKYVKVANRQMLVGVQIEHREAVDHIHQIVMVPGLDLVFLGLVDLAGSLGHPGFIHHPEVTLAVEKVVAVAREAGIALGIAVSSAEEMLLRIKQGFQFFHLGADMVYLGKACKQRVREVREVLSQISHLVGP